MALTVNDQLLSEAYMRLNESVTYTLPNSPKTLMSDFYVLNYISSINYDKLAELGNSNALRYSEDFQSDVQHAEEVMLPFLQKHMLDGVFFAMCAEIRHMFAREQPSDLFERWGPLMQAYHKYYTHYTSGFGAKDPRKPESEEYKKDSRGYQDSYAAIYKAAKQLGYSRGRVVNFFGDAFLNGVWQSSYGGRPWANIAKAWVKLSEVSPKDYAKLYIYIDHVYDLQHNTDTVFNKLRSYYLESQGYSWIKEMLDFKANVKSIQELFPSCSSQMVKLARPVLKAANLLKMKPAEPFRKAPSVHDASTIAVDVKAFKYLAIAMMEMDIGVTTDEPQEMKASISRMKDFYSLDNSQITDQHPLIKFIADFGADSIMDVTAHGEHSPTINEFLDLVYTGKTPEEKATINKFNRKQWYDTIASWVIMPEIINAIKELISANAAILFSNATDPLSTDIAKALLKSLDWYINAVVTKNTNQPYKDFADEMRTFYFNTVDLAKTTFGKRLIHSVDHALNTKGKISDIIDAFSDNAIIDALKFKIKTNLKTILGIEDSVQNGVRPLSNIFASFVEVGIQWAADQCDAKDPDDGNTQEMRTAWELYQTKGKFPPDVLSSWWVKHQIGAGIDSLVDQLSDGDTPWDEYVDALQDNPIIKELVPSMDLNPKGFTNSEWQLLFGAYLKKYPAAAKKALQRSLDIMSGLIGEVAKEAGWTAAAPAPESKSSEIAGVPYIVDSIHKAVTRLFGIYLELLLDATTAIYKHGNNDPHRAMVQTYFNTNNTNAGDIIHSQLMQLLVHRLSKDWAGKADFLNELCYMDDDTIVSPTMQLSLNEIKANSPTLARIIKAGKHDYSAAVLKDYLTNVVISDSGQLNSLLCKIIAKYRKPLELDLRVGASNKQSDTTLVKSKALVASDSLQNLGNTVESLITHDLLKKSPLPLVKSALKLVESYGHVQPGELADNIYVKWVGAKCYTAYELATIYDHVYVEYIKTIFYSTSKFADKISNHIKEIEDDQI